MNREEDIQVNSLWRQQAETKGFWGRVTREPPTGPIYKVIGHYSRKVDLEIWAGAGQPSISIQPTELLDQFTQYRGAKWENF